MNETELKELIRVGRLFEGLFQDGDLCMDANIWTVNNQPVIVEPYSTDENNNKLYFKQRAFINKSSEGYKLSINKEILNEERFDMLQETVNALQWQGIEKVNPELDSIKDEASRKKYIKESLDTLFADFWD